MEDRFKVFALGIFAISVAALCFEVALSYEFAFMFWFNVSIIVISIAMFGLGIGGVIGYFISRRSQRYFDILYFSCIFFGLAIIASLALISYGSRLSFKSSANSLIYFSLVSALPFVFSGVILSMGLNYPSADKRVIAFIYFSDLVGAGIGAFLITALLPFSTLESIILLCSILSILSAPLLQGTVDMRRGLATLVVATIVIATFANLNYIEPEPDREKFLYQLKSQGATILKTKWTSVSRVDVVEYADKSQIRFIVNGNFPVTAAYGNVSRQGIEGDPRYFMFAHKPKSMLAIGSGGGVEMLMALHAGVKDITAVEINPFIVEYMKNDLHEYSGEIYSQPEVETFIEDGRTLVHRTEKKFDLIENGVIGSNGLVVPSSTLLNFQDAYVYTVEANRDYWTHMTPDGVTVTIIWAPLDNYNTIDRERGITYYLLRQYFTVKQALLEEGVDPKKHLMFFIYRLDNASSQAEYTFIFKSALTEKKVKTLITTAEKYNLKCVYAPFLNSSIDFESIARALPSWRDVSPVYDDKPFFYHTEASSPKELNIMLKVLALLTFLFIIAPIALERRMKFEKHSSLILVVYFLCLGVGYILIEAVLIQKLTLFLGRPAYAFQVVLFSMLVFSGIGSFLNGMFIKKDKIFRHTYLILTLLTVAILIYAKVLPITVKSLMHMSILKKIFASIAILAPLAVAMGMPFPSGLRIASLFSENDVVWMYGVNGAGSVIGSIIGMIIAFNYGFSYSLIVGGAIYLLGLLSLGLADLASPTTLKS